MKSKGLNLNRFRHPELWAKSFRVEDVFSQFIKGSISDEPRGR